MAESRTLRINREQLEDVVISHLYAVGILNDNEEATLSDVVFDDDEVDLELKVTLRFPKRRIEL